MLKEADVYVTTSFTSIKSYSLSKALTLEDCFQAVFIRDSLCKRQRMHNNKDGMKNTVQIYCEKDKE